MRLCRLIALAGVLVVAIPLSACAEDLLPPETPIEQAIDHYIRNRLAQASIVPAPPADDAAQLRRPLLDLVGRVPTVAEVKAYLESTDEKKYKQLIDRLMASQAFIRQQTAEFDALLMDGTRQSLREYLTKAFGENRSWDRMFREMLVGEPDDARQQGRFASSPPARRTRTN